MTKGINLTVTKAQLDKEKQQMYMKQKYAQTIKPTYEQVKKPK